MTRFQFKSTYPLIFKSSILQYEAEKFYTNNWTCFAHALERIQAAGNAKVIYIFGHFK
jgi:hypothetical protein